MLLLIDIYARGENILVGNGGKKRAGNLKRGSMKFLRRKKGLTGNIRAVEDEQEIKMNEKMLITSVVTQKQQYCA